MADAQSEEPVFRLHLAPELDGLYLDIPISVVSSLCLYPVKYLRFLGYCILGVGGTIAKEFDGEDLSDEDPLDAGVYYFVREGDKDVLEHAVDPEALTYSHISETTNTRDYFQSLVAERDVSCIFTNTSEEMSQGIHIVPFSKGDAWLKYIVEARIAEQNEDDSNLKSINDIRNGMLVASHLHPMLDRKKLVVLKTPNRVLDCTDIPPPGNSNTNLYGDVKYSTNPRYTLQWLKSTEQQQRDIPNNKDAAFKKHSREAKPSPMLLNYNYGVAALKWWGKGLAHLLTARRRPAPPIPLGPSRSKHERSVTIAGVEGSSGGSREAEDTDERRQADAERLVLTFWANTPAARNHRAQQQAARKDRMAEWQNGVRMASET